MIPLDDWIFITPPVSDGSRIQGVVKSSTAQNMLLYVDKPVPHVESVSPADTVGFLFFPSQEHLEQWLEHENPKTEPEPDNPKVTKLKPARKPTKK